MNVINSPLPSYGYLPSSAPLANPYVPFQHDNPEMFEMSLGLVRGTIFPGLDLPFLNYENDTPLPPSPLSELQAVKFAVSELALFLDTHPDDPDAISLYRNYQAILQQTMDRAEAKLGPINHSRVSDEEQYHWLKGPWPWDYQPCDGGI